MSIGMDRFNPIIEIKNLSHRFPNGKIALEDVKPDNRVRQLYCYLRRKRQRKNGIDEASKRDS